MKINKNKILIIIIIIAILLFISALIIINSNKKSPQKGISSSRLAIDSVLIKTNLFNNNLKVKFQTKTKDKTYIYNVYDNNNKLKYKYYINNQTNKYYYEIINGSN